VNPVTLLRVAAGVTLLYLIGHLMGYPWTPIEGEQTNAVVEVMQAYRFDLMGSTRTYWHFYVGFGIAIAGYMLIQAVVLWQLASLAKSDAVRVRPVILTFLVGFALNAIVTWLFIFTMPALFAVAITVSLGLAFIATKRQVTRVTP
jgi:hypothetical protein